MPIFIQWKWQEKTETFLLILHFDADGSKPNLRNRNMAFWSSKDIEGERELGRNDAYYFPAKHREFFQRALCMRAMGDVSAITTRNVQTWAPTHVELGLMQELLSYANIINGFKIGIREELRKKLEVFFRNKNQEMVEYVKSYFSLVHDLPHKAFLFAAEEDSKKRNYVTICTELCPEYLEHLRAIVKPYMS